MKVLIADDHLVTRKMLQGILQKNGYSVIAAEDGQQAWDLLMKESDVRLWGFSHGIIEALFYHHQPSAAPTKEFDALTAVYAANVLTHRFDPTDNIPGDAVQVDLDYLSALGLMERIDLWRDTCLEAIEVD